MMRLPQIVGVAKYFIPEFVPATFSKPSGFALKMNVWPASFVANMFFPRHYRGGQ